MKKNYFYALVAAIFCAMSFCVSCETSDVDSNTDSSFGEGNSDDTQSDDTTSNQTTTYTISFDTDGGSTINSITVDDGEKALQPEDPTKTGYTFIGWYSDEELTEGWSFDTLITADATIYAKWQINSYSVTFNTNGGSEISEQMVNYNEKVVMPNDPTKTDYGFAGWYSDEELTQKWSFDTAITSQTTIYAKWMRVSGGIDDMETGTIW